jgi:hypothetical protein
MKFSLFRNVMQHRLASHFTCDLLNISEKNVFKLFYYVEYCLLLKALVYTAIELKLNNAVYSALMETSPLTETASSALPLPSTPMWKRAVSFTGISSRFRNVSDTLLVSETEHTNGQPETHIKIALLICECYTISAACIRMANLQHLQDYVIKFHLITFIFMTK